MIKVAVFLKRRADLTQADFFSWWLDSHRPLVEKIPGLSRYVISLSAGDEDGDFDGLAELCFNDTETIAAAFASKDGHAASADTRAHVSRRERLDLVQYPFLDTGKPARFKLVAALKRAKDMDRKAFKDWWLNRHARMVLPFPDLRRYQVSLVEFGEEGFADGIAEVCFEDLATLQRVTSSEMVRTAQQDSQDHTEDRNRLYVEEHVVI